MDETAKTKERLVARMRVAVRIRPPLPREVGQDGKFLSCVGVGPTTEKGQTIFINSSDKPVIMSSTREAPSGGGKISRYTFDKIFPPSMDQKSVYSYTMEPLVQAVMDGYNATVITLIRKFTFSTRNHFIDPRLRPDWIREDPHYPGGGRRGHGGVHGESHQRHCQ